MNMTVFCFALIWGGRVHLAFGGCFGEKNSLYKLIFVVLVFKAKTNKKTNPFLVPALHPSGGAVPTLEDAAACEGICWGFPFATQKPA